MESSIREHKFSDKFSDTQIHFQVVDIGRQLFIWIADDEQKLGNLYVTGLNFEVRIKRNLKSKSVTFA